MNPDHITYLRCPETGQPLTLEPSFERENGRVKSGALVTPCGNHRYEIEGFIPRFVSRENYAGSFGFQWNLHDKTQHDTTSRHAVSSQRWEQETRWTHAGPGTLMLEAGCGAGRFTSSALDTGAMVISFDYSDAVDAAYRAHGGRDNLLLVQADIFHMPFPPSFDYIYCFGVLQHTPDPRKAFQSLVSQLKPGGHLATDIYRKGLFASTLHPKYWVRPFTRNLPPEKLYKLVTHYIRIAWPLTRGLRFIPIIGRSLVWRLLVADHSDLLPDASPGTLKAWARLDTFDMLSPAYDLPVTVQEFQRWHEAEGLADIDVHKGFNGVEARARKPL